MLTSRLFAAVLAFSALVTPSAAQQQLWAAAYIDWSFEGAGEAERITQDLWVPQPAVASFFTLNFDFSTGEGGYIGLQSDDAGLGNVRFSLWNASSAQGRTCRRFDGEGEGMTCEAPLTIEPDRVYTVGVERVAADARGQWWLGWVQPAGGPRVEIGTLLVARRHTRIDPATAYNFSEYWGDAVQRCRDVPLSAAAFGPPGVLITPGLAWVRGTGATGRRPEGHLCSTGRELTGAVATHTPLQVGREAWLLMTLGGDEAVAGSLVRRLAARAPMPAQSSSGAGP